MGSGEHEQETQTLLELLGQREQKAMQIRKDILNATYAVIGLCVAATGWALDQPRGCSEGSVALGLVIAAFLASGYVCKQQQLWVREHEVIQRISRTLGCFTPGHYMPGKPLYRDEWDLPPPKCPACGVKASLLVIWAFATGSVMAMLPGWGVKAGLAAMPLIGAVILVAYCHRARRARRP